MERSTSKSHPCVYGGKALRLFSPHPQQRITPAHAGKRQNLPRPNLNYWDHPRACGEKTAPEPTQLLHSGSPPRMRGKVWSEANGKFRDGITPAHAGKSFQYAYISERPWDHPRACGEKSKFQRFHAHQQGSPPRMRGKGQGKTGSRPLAGITPAHAGKRVCYESDWLP